MNQTQAKYEQAKGSNRSGFNNNRKSMEGSLKPITAKQLPENFVDEAERVMRELGERDLSCPSRLKFSITTSKLRNILSLVLEIYKSESKRNSDKLTPESMRKIQMMWVRILYEAGRDEKAVKTFVEKSDILSYLKDIGESRKKFINFAQYMEALVAYHRFFGGKE